MNTKTHQYKGSLTYSEIAEGMNAARENASRLLEDAILLLENGRYPSALSLAVLSIEESGKLSIFRQMVLSKSEADLKSAWKSYRSHQKKNVAWIFVELYKMGARKIDQFKELYDENSGHPEILDQLKQLGFYSDCLGKAHWSRPIEAIDAELAKGIVTVAKVLLREKVLSEREIELWATIVGPVYNNDMLSMKMAVMKWFETMVSEGLLEEKEIKFSDFLGIE